MRGEKGEEIGHHPLGVSPRLFLRKCLWWCFDAAYILQRSETVRMPSGPVLLRLALLTETGQEVVNRSKPHASLNPITESCNSKYYLLSSQTMQIHIRDFVFFFLI